jgi:DNA topoisomerase-1
MQVHSARLIKLKDPVHSAKVVGLRYVTDEIPGFRREPAGRHFIYKSSAGKVLKDPRQLSRIKALAIPPAWTDVWICPDRDGHLQATGRDARRRKQHRYHPRWREIRDETKFNRMIAFAKALPSIRKRVSRDLARSGLPREKVLATVVRLLEVSLIRVGNDEYARDNDSFGLTTMKDRHVDVNGSKLRFNFRGKGGKRHNVDIRDPHLAKIVKSCQDLPGQELFQYLDEDGKPQDVRSSDVNDYLREISGADFTAKDFRTWAGTVLAAAALRKSEKAASQAEAKRNISEAIKLVAGRFGNTPAICRKCYVHPQVVNAYLEGDLVEMMQNHARTVARLQPQETAVVGLLQRRLRVENRSLASSLKASLRATTRLSSSRR